MQEVIFHFPHLATFSSQRYRRFLSGPVEVRKLSTCVKTCFFKTKDRLILFELTGMLKSVSYTALTSTK